MKGIQRAKHKGDNMIPKASFQALVREICVEQNEYQFRWTSQALEAIQISAEDYLVGLFEDAYLCSVHCKRVTLLAKDLQLARRIRGVGDPGNQ